MKSKTETIEQTVQPRRVRLHRDRATPRGKLGLPHCTPITDNMQRQVLGKNTFGFKSAYPPTDTLHGNDNARSGATIAQGARHISQRPGHPRPTFTRRQPWITGTTNARTTADSDFRPLGIRRRSTPELESLIARSGHPQQTTIAPATKLASSRVVLSRRRKSSRDAPHRPKKRTNDSPSQSFRSTLVTFGSISVIQVHPGRIRVHPGHSGPSWPHSGPSRSFRSILVTFGSIPVIQVYPGHIRVHPGHSGPSWSHSGPSRSFRSILVVFGSIPVIQVYPGSSAFGSIPVIQVYPGSSAFRSIPVSFGSIPVIISRAMSHYIQARHEQPWGSGIRAVAGPKKGVLLIIFGYIL
ncbi:hypothetical protein CRG98_042081 [Punica granatum]|uniref:Uncharacterized protein n=1 Tax=Punica granatum TaxID=22663 RepID=A0A2I0I0M6_PUNGR|nr:hypothetical protein CRG98_042081 [Punica granatum]